MQLPTIDAGIGSLYLSREAIRSCQANDEAPIEATPM